MPVAASNVDDGMMLQEFDDSSVVYGSDEVDNFGPDSAVDMLEAVDGVEEIDEITDVTRLEIGGGARIAQGVGSDPNPIDFWQEEPVGMIYVNYLLTSDAQRILDAGKREEKSEGALHGLNVGSE